MREAGEWLRAATQPQRPWSVVAAFSDLPAAERQEVRKRLKAGERHADPVVRAMARRCTEDVIIAEMAVIPISDHMVAELHAAARRGAPLAPGERVPRCTCEDCRPDSLRHRSANRDRSDRTRRDLRPALDVDAARAVPILHVAARLGIEHRRGWGRCPFHSDARPSFHLNPRKNRCYCNVCAGSWDGIALVMELRGLSFVSAIRELIGRSA
jgi:hypothetical protein